jgi:c-di-AMP phosphodiesterase-like protein
MKEITTLYNELKAITDRMDELGVSTLGMSNGATLTIDDSFVYYRTNEGETTFKRALSKLGGAL